MRLAFLLLSAAGSFAGMAAAQEEPSFRVDVQLVRILATVKDPGGALVGSLDRNDFAVIDNGVAQQIAVFERQIIPAQTGRLGYAVRVSPNHYDDPLTRPVTSLLKWGGR